MKTELLELLLCPKTGQRLRMEKGNSQVKSRNWMFQETFFSEKVPHTACVNAIKADPNGTACASLDIIENVFPTGTYIYAASI